MFLTKSWHFLNPILRVAGCDRRLGQTQLCVGCQVGLILQIHTVHMYNMPWLMRLVKFTFITVHI
jgi:hypothetical protein